MPSPSCTPSYIFAGDTHIQHMRIEKPSPFPVHRYGPSIDAERHKFRCGIWLVKYLVEQCHEYDLVQDDKILEKIGAQNGGSPSPSQFLNSLKNSDCVVTKVTEESRKGHHFESVAVVKETGLIGDDDELKGFRISQTHSVADSTRDDNFMRCSESERASKNASKKAAKNPVENFEDRGSGVDGGKSILVLSLDGKKFDCGKEFDQLSRKSFDRVVARLAIPRAAVHSPKKKQRDDDIDFKEFLKKLGALVNPPANEEGRKNPVENAVLVIGSESLRNAGFDVSYRVGWERAITDCLRILEEEQTPSVSPLASLLNHFHYVVVSFYNDGVVILPTRRAGTVPNETVIVVASPSQVEADHSKRFHGSMRGTETLVAASIAYELGRRPEVKFTMLQQLQKAVVHGAKASRYLQCHGHVTLHPCAAEIRDGRIMEPENAAQKGDQKYIAYANISAKSVHNNYDALRFLWNRTRSIDYALSGGVRWAEDKLADAKAESTRLCMWPIGDVVEILAGGYPTYGGFPPVALKLTEGRDAIDEETKKVMQAWRESNWLEVGRVDRSKAWPGKGSDYYPWWSLRAVAVDHLAKALEAGKPSAQLDQAKNVARFILAELVVRFGYREMNRSANPKANPLDLLALDWVFYYSRAEIPVPKFYGDYFENFGFKDFLTSYLGNEIEIKEGDGTKDLRAVFKNMLKTDPWLSLPASGSFLGLIPEFEIGKLRTNDRRDAQSFREIRERLLGFQASSEQKPLNLLVLGGPGSGKSFGVKQILEGVYSGVQEIAFLEYNVASFAGDRSALTSAFLEIQDVALKGKLPIAFWDEYDTTIDKTKLAWLGAFLGPMQDGKFFLGQTSRNLPKCVFVFAGSIFSSLKEIVDLDVGGVDSEHVEIEVWQAAKGKDFKSRITGVLEIPSVDPPKPVDPAKPDDSGTKAGKPAKFTEDQDSWLFRRACSLRNAFEMQAKHLLNRDRELQISTEVLFALLTIDRFYHGQRSIDSLVRMSSLHGRAVVDGSVVPTDTQVSIHAEEGFFHEGALTYASTRVKDWFQ